jgi:hypothetical protein
VLDHLVYAAPQLDAAVHDLAGRLGVAPSAGGQHVGRGTRNYLLSFGEGAYLEIIGPDHEQPAPPTPRPFGLDRLQQARLVGWEVKATNIDRRVEDARAAGYDPGPVVPLTRTLPNGTVLRWRLTASAETICPNPIPFLIDWGSTSHPSTTASQGARLLDFHAESPNPDDVQTKLQALGVSLLVSRSNRSILVASLLGPAGSVTIT